MPSLSERDLGHVEKLFNAVRSVLEYDRTHRSYSASTALPTSSANATVCNTSSTRFPTSNFTAASPASRSSTGSLTLSAPSGSSRNTTDRFGYAAVAPTSTVKPSAVLQDHQDQQSERNRSAYPASSVNAVSSGVPEQRLWAELAFLMWRVVGLQKLSLMAFVTSDPSSMLAELARALLSFLKESCVTFAGNGKEMRMRQVALLAQDRLLFLLSVFCDLKNCTVMLSEASGPSSTADGRAVFDAIGAVVVAGAHFSWMSQIYVWFCDEASRFARVGGSIPSAYVYATYDALRCILGCCTNQEACARAFLNSEPVACVTYMFHGLKLRISACDVLRPYEDDHPLKETPTSAAGSQESTSGEGGSSNNQPTRSPIPLRPPGARFLKTRYFSFLTLNSAASAPVSSVKQQHQPQQRDSPTAVNCSAVASLVYPSPSTSSKANLSTSWAFDIPDLTREQLKQLLLGGRQNSFDILLFAALDIVIEVLRVTRDYGHWMVLSMVNNLLLLSKKNIEVGLNPSMAASLTATQPLPPSLSQVVAMYENITVMFEFLFCLMQGLDDDTPSRGKDDSCSPDAEKIVGVSTGGVGVRSRATDSSVAVKGEKKSRGEVLGSSGTFSGCRGDVTPSSSSPYVLSAQARAGRGGFNTGSEAPAPSLEEVATSSTSPHDIPQLREDFSQHMVHMMLQADVHAVVTATTRVLQCDCTLFRVLHQFCVLDARTIGQPKFLPRAPDSTSSRTSGNTSPLGRRSRNAPLSNTVADTTPSLYTNTSGSGADTARALVVSSLPLASVGSPYSSTAATLAPYLFNGSGVRGLCLNNVDAAADKGGSAFDAAAGFFTVTNVGDLRQMVNKVGVGGSETPNDGAMREGGLSGDLGGSHSSLHGTHGSGLGDSTHSSNLQNPSFSAQKLQKKRRLNRSQDANKKGGSGDSENFATSFFKSFFCGSKKGGRLLTHCIANDVDEAAEGNSDNEGKRDGNSTSSSSSPFASWDRSGSDDDDSDNDPAGSAVDTSDMGSLPMPRSFGVSTSGGSRNPRLPSFSLQGQRTRCSYKHHHSHAKARPQYSPWRDVPSYTALVSEFVRILNLVLADAELFIDVRLGAGMLLPSVVLRDSQVFRLYEGRVLIRNYISLLLHELQYSSKLRSTTDDGVPLQQPQQPQMTTCEIRSQDKQANEVPAQGPGRPPALTNNINKIVVNGRTHLTQRELIVFATRVIEALEQTFKVLGATPLTSDVTSLTELQLYFFCTDRNTPFGNALERSFTRVVVLWLIGLVGAQCDEDIDRHAMEVLLHIMNRAVARGSLPKDSSTTLMPNAAGTATVVQISLVSGTAVPTAAQGLPEKASADWVESRRSLLADSRDLSPQAVSAVGGAFSSSSGLTAVSLAGKRSELAASSTSAFVPTLTDDGIGDFAGLYCNHVNDLLFDNTEFVGLVVAAGVDRATAECGNTVEALGSVFSVLLGRSPDLLTPSGLATVLALFASHESNVSRLGRECMTRSLETSSSYALYAEVILDSDSAALAQILSVISAYLNSSALTPVARHERRVWMQRAGCVDAVIRVLVRVLDSPHSTPTFMKIIPYLFQFLSAFESVDHKAPHLSSTNFVAVVTEQLEKLEGIEYFIIVAQAVLDSCTGTYGGVDDGYTSAGGPGAHYAEMHVVGNFHVAQYNCAAEKPVFLELLPSLLCFAEKHSAQLYNELVGVLFRVVECTGNVRSDRLADFILDHGLSQMLPYMELSGPYIEERLPFTGTTTELHRFWHPVLLLAPRRSELRFTSYGGVQISVGIWPNTGFTIAVWFKFDRLYSTIPLFEFHGLMNDSVGGLSSLRSSSNLTALLFIFGGDSMQLALNDARRITVNEKQALQNFVPNKWMHVCAVLRTTQVLEVYVNGFKVGTTFFPAFLPGSEVRVNVGCTDESPHHLYGSGTSSNIAPLFSISDVTLWAQALNRSQVEAELASSDCCTMSSSRPVVPAKVFEEAIPQALTLVRNMGSFSSGAAVGSPELAGGNLAGFAALINPKSSSSVGGGAVSNSAFGARHDTRNVLGLPFSISASASGETPAGYNSNNTEDEGCADRNGNGWTSTQSWLPISTRMARFVPYENDDSLLCNVLSSSTSYPVVAKLVGRYAAPPKTWVDYPLLWATRGGVMRLLDWLHLVASSAHLEGLLQLITECFLRTTLAVTLDARTYMLLGYMLTHHVAAFFTKAACDHLLTLASSHINVFDEEHRIIVNRLVFEHILGNVVFYAAIPLDAALYLLQRVRRLFHTSQCRYAKHNARFVIPYSFVDRLLHSLVGVATRTPLLLCNAVVQVAQQVVVACDMDEDLVHIFVSLVALLTPGEAAFMSRSNPRVKVTLPTMNSMIDSKNLLPLRTANHLTTLLLSSLVEFVPQGVFIAALAHTVDLPWYASCLSRFADPVSVLYATRIFFEAVEHNPLLREEAMQHQAAIIEALTVHAIHEDLVLLLLAQSVGAARHVDVLSRKHSLLQQLDSVMSAFPVHPNPLVATVFVKIFVLHLYRTVQIPHQLAIRSTTALLSEQRLSYRVRRYLSLIRVCSQIMLHIRVRRYRAQLLYHTSISTVSTPMHGSAHLHHLRAHNVGIMDKTSTNMSFAHSIAKGVTPTAAKLGSVSVTSNAHAGGAVVRGVHSSPDMPSFSASPLGLQDAVMNSVDSRCSPQTAPPQAFSLAQHGVVGGGDGYVDDGELSTNCSMMSSYCDARQLPQPLLPPLIMGRVERSSQISGEDGFEDAVPQWKPPVLLPDTRSVPAVSTTAMTAMSSALIVSQQTTPRTSSLSHHMPADHTAADARGCVKASQLTSPTDARIEARQTRMCEGMLVEKDVTSSESGDDSDEREAYLELYVHSRKHKRAFAALRVCVLLWLPLQVRRLRWIFTVHSQPREEDYAKRHASTLFCIRMFRYFASFSSNFYLFTNSPLQTGALSALVAYISRDMLTEGADVWDQLIRSMISASVRDAVTADNVASAMAASGSSVAVGTPTTHDSSTMALTHHSMPSKRGSGAFPHHGLDAAINDNKTASQQQAMKGEENVEGLKREEDKTQAYAVEAQEMVDENAASSSLLRVSTLSSPPQLLPSTANNNSNNPSANRSGSTFADEGHRGSGSTATPVLLTRNVSEQGTSPAPPLNVSRLTRPAEMPTSTTQPLQRVSSMTFRRAESSSAQLVQMTVLESPQPSEQFVDDLEDDVEDGVPSSAAAAQGPHRRTWSASMVDRSGVNDTDANSLSNASFDAEDPPLINMTRVPPQRLRVQHLSQLRQRQQQNSSKPQLAFSAPPTAIADSVPLILQGKENLMTKETTATTAAVAAAAIASTLNASGKHSAKTEDGDNDDSSSVSSHTSSETVLSRSSVASINSAPIAFSALSESPSSNVAGKTALSPGPATATAKKAVNAPTSSYSNLPGVPSALLADNAADGNAANTANVMASVSEVVRRDAVGILQALIRSSLDTLPVPHWIGGPTYGSCGGLLFQLLLIVSAKTAADDATTTLVRYFLLSVGNAVKEQCDCDLAQPPRQDSVASPLSAHSPKSMASASPGLGDPGFDHGLMAALPPTSRGTPIGNDATLRPISLPMSGGGDAPDTTNASFASSVLLPPLSAVGGTSVNTVNSDSAPHAPPAGTLTPPAPTQQSTCLPSIVASLSSAEARHTAPSVQPPVMQRASNSGLPHSPHQKTNSSSRLGIFSDVFLFNVNHFTDLIVDMLTINVLDLPMATHYFLTLLVLCQQWPRRYIDQLSWQVIQACIAVLNRPSAQDANLGLIESIYTLTTLVLRRGWKRSGVLECLFRVLYRVYGSLPPAWMSDADARHRKRLITLIFRHIVQTYSGTKELEKALTVRTFSQRLSLYDDFVMIFSLSSEEESIATFEQYSVAQSSSIETLVSGRLKVKADLAFKASIKTRSEYIKRIEAFNNQYVQATEVAERYKKAELKRTYACRFSSYVATTPVLDGSQLHWLLTLTCALRGDHHVSACAGHHEAKKTDAAAGGSDESKIKSVSASSEAQFQQMRSRGDVTLYHFLDSELNHGEFKGVLWGKERAKSDSNCSGGASHELSSASALQHRSSDYSAHEFESTAVVAETEPPEAGEEQPAKNDLVRAAQCEEVVQHIAVLLPPFSTRCRPYLGGEALFPSLKDVSITLTPSAVTLLRYLLAPHETLRFISNGFRINGIQATPCLILLTNTTLKIVGFSRVTEAGDIILCEYEDEDEDEPQNRTGSNNALITSQNVDAKTPSHKSTRRNIFSMSSMTKQFQKFFTVNSTKRRQQHDGTRVAQAVRQVVGRNYQNVFWSYLVSSIRTVRSLRYMHLDTAVQLQLYYDEGPMLSVVDAKQSMNPSARKEFLKVLKGVVAPQECTFVDESQRVASIKSNLVRWATGALSNYEYLRFLNEVAGRTRRDLNQYPVFPWVLADYTSATLDLESASTFRKFGYPMGAQKEERRGIVAQLFENTREVCDVDTGKSYPFHHGTHYSTSGGVLYFLLRLQPFTTYARLFQGGDFDLAMRLFDSVAASFDSCVMGPADCKELIPEFYVSNSFLTNADHLLLGIKSNGEPVDDVRLPPWAKNSRQVFTAVMRYALESYYVMEHLHQWIDLVFGVRRCGPLAMERYNVFQRMTYGEEVVQALKDAETPHDCDVIIAEVDNFGQTPPQLFQERHPSHQELVPVVQSYAADGGSAGHGTGSGSRGGGAGTAGNSKNNGGNSGSSAGRNAAPSSGNVSAITLGGLYTSAHSSSSATGTGTQLGATFSNLLSSGAFASGQTYTQAFRREAPKVVRILIHAMDETQSWFVLRDPPSGVLQHPPPPVLAENFRNLHPAVLNFIPLHTSKKLACAYAQLFPVPDTDYYFCWHEREARLMRYTAGQAVFQSMVAFNPPDESGAIISAVAVGTRESVLLIAISTGAVYCFFPDSVLGDALHLNVTLCYHRSPVEKIVLDSTRRRAVTITRGHSDDEPILWRVQRSGCNFLCRLAIERLLPVPTEAELAAQGKTAEDAKDARKAVDAAVDSVSGYIAIVTTRSLVIFDNNGDPFGAGTLPSPNLVRAVDSVTLEDDNGDVGVVVGRAFVVMPNLSAVTFYQTSEWAAGMSVLITGHVDGSLSVWRCTRLPPDTVEPGKIAMVEFHARLFSGMTTSNAPLTATGASSAPAAAGATAALNAGSGDDGGVSSASGRSGPLSRYPSLPAAGAVDRTTVSISVSASTVNAALAGLAGSSTSTALLSRVGSAGCVGICTGTTNCPVTCLHQEHTEVPTFLVGYENGSIRQLTFEDPALMTSGGSSGSSGAGGNRDVSGGDDRRQRW